jgi:regulatory protein
MRDIKETALSLLSKKSYSAKKLSEKLKDKGYQDLQIGQEIERLKKLKFIDDAAFAASFTERLFKKNKGVLLIEIELKKCGIDSEIAAAAIKEICGGKEAYEQILEVMRKKYKNVDMKDEKFLSKVGAFFIARGFAHDDIEKAFNAYCEPSR